MNMYTLCQSYWKKDEEKIEFRKLGNLENSLHRGEYHKFYCPGLF